MKRLSRRKKKQLPRILWEWYWFVEPDSIMLGLPTAKSAWASMWHQAQHSA